MNTLCIGTTPVHPYQFTNTWCADVEKNGVICKLLERKKYPLILDEGIIQDILGDLLQYDAKFYMIITTDTYVHVPNLLQLLEQYTETDKVYLKGSNQELLVNKNVANLLVYKMENIEPILYNYFYDCNIRGWNPTISIKIEIDLNKCVTCRYMEPADMEQYHAYIHEITWTVITHFTDTHFNQVVKIDGNLVAFCNSSTYIKVWNRRKELNLLHKTFIYIEEPNISKVLRENPFLSKNFAWMASEIKFQKLNFLSKSPKKIHVNTNTYIDRNRGTSINMQFFTIPGNCKLSEISERSLTECLLDNFPIDPFSKPLLSTLNFYITDPDEAVDNYRNFTISGLINYTVSARMAGNSGVVLTLCKILITEKLSGSQYIQILDEYFLATWYSDNRNYCISLLNDFITKYTEADREWRNQLIMYLNAHISHIVRNFDYLRLLLPRPRILIYRDNLTPEQISGYQEKYPDTQLIFMTNITDVHRAFLNSDPVFRPKILGEFLDKVENIIIG